MNPLYARRRLLGRNVYKKTVEGNPAIAQGSLARRYPGITMQGWTEQAQYEGKNLLNNNSNSWVVGKSISWGAGTGTPISYSNYGTYAASILIDGIKPNTKYSFKNLNISAVWVNRIVFADNSGNGYQNVALYGNVETHNHEEYSVTSANNENITCAYFQVRTLPDESGEIVAITEQDIKNMLVCFSEGDPIYEPYTGGQPSPNPDYPQEIISAGKYDEETQKYEYEITLSDNADRTQNLTLISNRPLTKWDRLEKRDGVWGWVRKSAEITMDGSEYWMLYTNNKSENLYGFQHNISNLVMKNTSEERGFIDKIPSISQGISSTNKMAAQFGSFNTTLYILLPREYFSEHSVSALTEWLSENPLMVLYETAEETFVPLSESEQAAMNELYTFRPTTVLSNDCDCNMTLTYKTKKSLEVTT